MEKDPRQELILSSYKYEELAKMAKSIRKMKPEDQIELFKKIGIENTLIIDLKELKNKQIKTLLFEVEQFETKLLEAVQSEQRK